MLLNIRDIVTGWFAVFIVAILIIPFAFWGINYYFDQGGTQNVARVNDKPISVAEFQRAYQDYRRQIQDRLGQQVDTLNNEFLRQETLNRLIENEVLLQMARDSGLHISDEDVIEDISKLEAFRNDSGRFDQARYQMALQRAGMTSSSFEQQVRTEMLLRQLQDTVVQSAFVTDAEVTRLAQIEAQKRDIVHAMIEARPIYDSIEVSEADINSYYENNIDNYRAQARVKIDYLDLTIDSLVDEVSVTEEDLRAYYESNKSAYSVEETRKVTQMYLKLDEDAEQTRVDEARETMEFVQEKMDEGMAMDEIAAQYQSRLGPDFEQISLGHTPRGVMAPELDEVVFAMDEDETSDIIHSRVGMHIVRLDGINPATTPSFDSVREDVEADYRRYQAEQLFFEYADRLATLAYENPHTLDVAADELGMEVQTSDWFTEGSGEGIAAEPKVAMTSFSDEILREELNSEAIELGDSRLMVLRKADYQPSQPLPLEQVREEIIDDIKYERARKQAAEQGQAILQALRDGKSREALAAEYGIEWQQAEGVTRDDPNVNRSVLRTAFSIADPAGTSVRYKGNGLGSGDYIIVGVSGIETPAAETITAERKDELRQQLIQAAARNSWENLIKDARGRAKVRVNQQTLDS